MKSKVDETLRLEEEIIKLGKRKLKIDTRTFRSGLQKIRIELLAKREK